jgi:nitrogen-specific signal transduction histidine kinase
VVLDERIDQQAGYVHLSPTELQQILLNLGSNAYHAMRESGGTLTVEVRTATPEELPQGSPGDSEHILVRVADTGPGMSAETARRALEPFFTTKPVGEGTGIGLSSVHGIVGGAGGVMSIEAAEGFGTTVRIFLPRVTPAAAESLRAAVVDTLLLDLGDEVPRLDIVAGSLLRRIGHRPPPRSSRNSDPGSTPVTSRWSRARVHAT